MAATLSQVMDDLQDQKIQSRFFSVIFVLGISLEETCTYNQRFSHAPNLCVSACVYVLSCQHLHVYDNLELSLSGGILEEHHIQILQRRRNQLALVCMPSIKENHKLFHAPGSLQCQG